MSFDASDFVPWDPAEDAAVIVHHSALGHVAQDVDGSSGASIDALQAQTRDALEHTLGLLRRSLLVAESMPRHSAELTHHRYVERPRSSSPYPLPALPPSAVRADPPAWPSNATPAPVDPPKAALEDVTTFESSFLRCVDQLLLIQYERLGRQDLCLLECGARNALLCDFLQRHRATWISQSDKRIERLRFLVEEAVKREEAQTTALVGQFVAFERSQRRALEALAAERLQGLHEEVAAAWEMTTASELRLQLANLVAAEQQARFVITIDEASGWDRLHSSSEREQISLTFACGVAPRDFAHPPPRGGSETSAPHDWLTRRGLDVLMPRGVPLDASGRMKPAPEVADHDDQSMATQDRAGPPHHKRRARSSVSPLFAAVVHAKRALRDAATQTEPELNRPLARDDVEALDGTTTAGAIPAPGATETGVDDEVHRPPTCQECLGVSPDPQPRPPLRAATRRKSMTAEEIAEQERAQTTFRCAQGFMLKSTGLFSLWMERFFAFTSRGELLYTTKDPLHVAKGESVRWLRLLRAEDIIRVEGGAPPGFVNVAQIPRGLTPSTSFYVTAAVRSRQQDRVDVDASGCGPSGEDPGGARFLRRATDSGACEVIWFSCLSKKDVSGWIATLRHATDVALVLHQRLLAAPSVPRDRVKGEAEGAEGDWETEAREPAQDTTVIGSEILPISAAGCQRRYATYRTRIKIEASLTALRDFRSPSLGATAGRLEDDIQQRTSQSAFSPAHLVRSGRSVPTVPPAVT